MNERVAMQQWRRARRVTLAGLAGGLLASAAPAQAPPPVPDGSETVRIIPAAPVERSPAEAYRLDNMDGHPRGLWAHTAHGDIVLRNEMAYFAFGAPPGQGPNLELRDPAAASLRAGALLDVTSDPAAPEALQFFMPTLGGSAALRHEVQAVTRRTEPDGSAVVEVLARDPQSQDVSIRTEYLMPRDLPGVIATTTITNNGTETAKDITSADRIAWGAMAPFIPGQGWAPPVERREGQVEFLFARHHDVYIMVAPESGEAFYTQANGIGMMRYAEAGDLEPGETRVFRRHILVTSTDPADLHSQVVLRRPGASFGTLVGRMIERRVAPDGTIVDGSPGANLEVRITPLRRPDWSQDQLAARENRPYLLTFTNERGEIDLVLPEGEYIVFPAPYARAAERPTMATRIRPGQVTVEDFGISPPTTLEYRIVDAETKELMPGKLTIEALRGTMPLDHGFPGGALAGNTVLSTYGGGSIPIAPGSYRVVASCGPEHDIAEQRVRVAPPEGANPGGAIVTLELRRAFETPGWVSADIGARTNATENSRVLPQVRVISAVAEGIDWLVTGDSGVATDLSGFVRDMNLASRITTSPGFRFSGMREPFLGDWLLFPTDICSTGASPDLGLLLDVTDTAELLQGMRALCPEAAILLSRPTWPVMGYLTLQGHTSGPLPEGAWSRDFDAVQIWEGKVQGQVNSGYGAYHQLLRSGIRPAPIGNSDSHGTLNDEVGYPRVYIQSSMDNPAALDPAELARNIKRGMVSVTNGPFIDMKVNGQGAGSLVTDTDGNVELALEVFAANWVDVQAIGINLNGRFVRQILLPPSQPNRKGGRVYPEAGGTVETILVPVDRDAVLDIVVQGGEGSTMDPVNPFNPPLSSRAVGRGQVAMAFSAPIYVDADGDGLLTITADDAATTPMPTIEDPNDPPF